MPAGEAASLLSNGDFEAPVESADSYNYDVFPTGWFGSVEYLFNVPPPGPFLAFGAQWPAAYSGNQYADVAGQPVSYLAQSFTVPQPGDVYNLVWYDNTYQAPGDASGPYSVEVLDSNSNPVSGSTGNYNAWRPSGAWAMQSLTFSLCPGTYTLKFYCPGWDESEPLLDNVSLKPVIPVEYYLWGLDLSGTPQGAGLPGQSGATAGGVGGLLDVNDAANGAHFAAYDGNGNISGLVSAAGGTNSALYEYGPFGELLRATGPMAKANPLRFSTKYQDDETDLLYYGRRYLNTSTGRWINRDPIGRKGGANLYGFVGNSPLSTFDNLGLVAIPPGWPSPYGSGMGYYVCPKCWCREASWEFVPGGRAPQFHIYPDPIPGHNNADRWGSQLHVRWTVVGDPSFCHYYQDETNSAMIAYGPDGQVFATGVGSNADIDMGPDYYDPMGFNPIPHGTYEVRGVWTISLRCVSSDPKIRPVIQPVGAFIIDEGFTYP